MFSEEDVEDQEMENDEDEDMKGPEANSSNESEYSKKKWINYAFMVITACVSLAYYVLTYLLADNSDDCTDRSNEM